MNSKFPFDVIMNFIGFVRARNLSPILTPVFPVPD